MIRLNAALLLLTLLPAQRARGEQPAIRYRAEAAASVAGGRYAPFWLVADRYGLPTTQRSSGYLRAGLFRDPVAGRGLTGTFGIDGLVGWNRQRTFVLQQLYASLRLGAFELEAGCRERSSEMGWEGLSSGGLTHSSNARPLPQARLSIHRFAPVPWTGGWVQVRGHVAYGCFTDGSWQKRRTAGRYRYTRHVLYHSKALFVRAGDPARFPLVGTVGLEMAAQFGGTIRYPDGRVQSMPHRFKDYLRVLWPTGGDHRASESDQRNVLGNQLGSFHAAIGWEAAAWSVELRYEHFFEDGSGIKPGYGAWKDGLWAVAVRFPENRIASRLVVEYLTTRHQSGAFHHVAEPGMSDHYTGADNYYNHGEYVGWQHWGQGVGNPFVLAPLYNASGDPAFASNRLSGFNIGVEGRPASALGYRIRFGYTRHWGTYGRPLDAIGRVVSLLVELQWRPERLSGWCFTLAGAVDRGGYIGRNAGCLLTLTREGPIRRKR